MKHGYSYILKNYKVSNILNILFDHQIFTKQKYGGISRYFYNLAHHLYRQKHNIKIHTPLYKNKYIKELPPAIVSGKYVRNFFPKTTRFINRYSIKKFERYVNKINIDIFHSTYYNPLSDVNRNYKMILTVYDMIQEKFADSFFVDDLTTHNKRNAVKNADHIICISESTRRDLVELFHVPVEKTTVVYLGFDLEEYRTDNVKLNTLNKPFLLYVGERFHYKNFKGFVSAFSKSKKLMSDFDLMCFGGKVFSRSERKFFHQLGFNESQIFH